MKLMAFVLMLLLTAPVAAAWKVDVGDQAPAWTSTDYLGETVSFPEVTDGKPAVVIFWATWCNYCSAFMPYLKTLQADYAEAGVNIVAINAKERGIGDSKAYLEALGFPVTGILEGDDIAAAYDIQFIPGLMIVNGKGEVAYRRASTDLPPGKTLSEIWDAELRSVLDRLLR
jgi:thiol-disulfide isomerase/thioredoxin